MAGKLGKRSSAHIPYLVNLASPDKELYRKSIDRLLTEISRAIKFGVSLLVLHPGSYGKSKKEEGIKRIVEALNNVLQEIDFPGRFFWKQWLAKEQPSVLVLKN